jgi:serine/threonine protein kinase
MLGQGAFSTVWRCTHRKEGKVRAIKRIDTKDVIPREIAHEIALMRLLRHDNVVRCYDVFLEAQFVNIVVDMFTGGDLIDGLNAHVQAWGRIPDAQLAHISRQMVAAVAHVHSLLIVHRDIKGENFLSDRPDIGDPDCRVALADFGTAVRVEEGKRLEVKVGTPAFWAPEVWREDYDFLVDIWAVGVTVFILLTCALPFEGEEQICSPVKPGQLPFAEPYFSHRLCTDFMAQCLAKDPKKRLKAEEAKNHPWMKTPPLKGPRKKPGFPQAVGSIATGICNMLGVICVGSVHCFCCCLEVIFSDIKGNEGGTGQSPKLTDEANFAKQVTDLEHNISSSHLQDLLQASDTSVTSTGGGAPTLEV